MSSLKMGQLDLFDKVTEAERGKVCHQDISTSTICITSKLIPLVYMKKLKVKFNDW